MNPEAEALIAAYEAYLEDESERRWQIFQSHLDDAVDRTGISQESILRAVRTACLRKQRAENKKPPTIPPRA